MHNKQSPKSPPREMGREIATTGDSLDILRGPSGIIQPQSFGVLRSLSANLDIFEDILTDHEVQSTLSQRRLALIGKEWNVDPGGDAPIDQEAADWMKEQLDALAWDDVNDKMHYGVFYGFSVGELLYRRDGRYVAVDCIKVRKRKRFRFDLAGNLRLITRENVVDGKIMPPAKFWTFATGGDSHDNPYGIGLAHWLYWPTFFKNKGIKFWLIFLDKFAMPTAVGKHDYGDNQEKVNKLVDALKAIHTDSGVAIPNGVEFSLLEAKRSGTTDYATLCAYMDKAVQKVVIGQTASSEGTPGRLGNEDLQAEVRSDLIKADSDLICESWNRGPGRWLTEWNFPGAKPPRVWRDVEPPEDLQTRSERDKNITEMGFKPKLDYIDKTYGEGFEEKQAPVMDPAGPAVPKPNDEGPPGSEFAAGRVLPPSEALESALTRLLDDDERLNRQTAQVIEPVFALVRRHGPEASLSRLVELYPRISVDRFTDMLGRVQFIADIMGRLSADAEANN